jgi:mono/diheme cytochrome c family protein
MSRISPKLCGAALVFLVVAAGFAQSPRDRAKDPSIYAELGQAPNKAAARSNPLASDPEAVAAGNKLFDLHCAECHGTMAEGSRRAPSLLAEEVQRSTPGTLFWLLTNGVVRRGMPVWSKLPEPQRWQLVSYIKSFSPSPRPTPESKEMPHP